MSKIERMTVVFPEPMAEQIRAAVDAGEYASTSEVVRDAVRLWNGRRELRAHERSREAEHGENDEQFRNEGVKTMRARKNAQPRVDRAGLRNRLPVGRVRGPGRWLRGVGQPGQPGADRLTSNEPDWSTTRSSLGRHRTPGRLSSGLIDGCLQVSTGMSAPKVVSRSRT